MKHKRKRHLTGDEIQMMMRDLAQQKKAGDKGSYIGMCAVVYWLLTEKEHLSDDMLIAYNEHVHEYLGLVDQYGQEEIDLLRERWNGEIKSKKDKAVMKDGYVTLRKDGNPLFYYQKQKILLDNQIVDKFDKFMLCHLNTLLDMGWSKKRILNNKKDINEFIDGDLGGMSFQEIKERLENEHGIELVV